MGYIIDRREEMKSEKKNKKIKYYIGFIQCSFK